MFGEVIRRMMCYSEVKRGDYSTVCLFVSQSIPILDERVKGIPG